MKINTAADLASVLDPERQVEGWWRFECYRNQADGRFKFKTTQENPGLPKDGTFTVYESYIGPADLHTAREHAWRMEDYILKNNVCDYMPNTINMMEGSTSVFLGESILRSTNHSAALVATIERVGG